MIVDCKELRQGPGVRDCAAADAVPGSASCDHVHLGCQRTFKETGDGKPETGKGQQRDESD